ncbi:hypothetical protein BDW42DRAFT_197337 [Aspergillus taichungensis]|uniref:Rhodopsin domain-containing protein n=1 Tax=Aspergillus taichungensis TaxID=482145 RepID=A0A2J5HGT8_9EURO|nr:hypothetical protein BDW42DRAFT_197337 [Aspergillus taichungensis]
MFQSFQKGVFISGFVYVPALAFAKASLIILYYRIMGQQKMYRWCIYILSFVVGGYSLRVVLALIFACNPLAKSWDKSIIEGHCVDQNGLYIPTAVTNTVTHVALLVLPLPMVFTLNMPTVQKFGLSLVFLVGCATVVTSVIRLVTLFPFLLSPDPTYEIAWTDLWINVEANFIIICTCLPFVRQFCRSYAPRFIGEGSTQGLRYFTGGGYHDDSISRSRARCTPGLTLLQDDVELADGGGTHSQIIKEVHWSVTTECADESPNAGMRDQYRGF